MVNVYNKSIAANQKRQEYKLSWPNQRPLPKRQSYPLPPQQKDKIYNVQRIHTPLYLSKSVIHPHTQTYNVRSCMGVTSVMPFAWIPHYYSELPTSYMHNDTIGFWVHTILIWDNFFFSQHQQQSILKYTYMYDTCTNTWFSKIVHVYTSFVCTIMRTLPKVL